MDYMSRSRASAQSLSRIRRSQARALGYLLIRCGQLWSQLAIATVNAEAHDVVLRDAHTRLFPYLTNPDGVRVTDLARQLGVSKQAIQPLIGELESAGVVSVAHDATDARARRVFLSEIGAAAFARGTSVLVSIEKAASATLGTSRVERLRRDLADLLPVLQTSVASGAPAVERAKRGRRSAPAAQPK